MPKTFDLGRPVDHGPVAAPFKQERKRQCFPSLQLDAKTFPPVKDWQVGREYTVTLKLRQTSKSEHRKGEIEAGFDVLTAEVA